VRICRVPCRPLVPPTARHGVTARAADSTAWRDCSCRRQHGRGSELVRGDDPDLTAARGRAGELLRHGAAHPDDPAEPARVLAGWALVHGLATLLQEGNVVPSPGDDIAALARCVTRQLRTP
jgi:hypothetical protein